MDASVRIRVLALPLAGALALPIAAHAQTAPTASELRVAVSNSSTDAGAPTGSATHTVSVRNDSSAEMTNIAVTVEWAFGAANMSALSPDIGTLGPGGVWNVPALASGQTAQLTVSADWTADADPAVFGSRVWATSDQAPRSAPVTDDFALGDVTCLYNDSLDTDTDGCVITLTTQRTPTPPVITPPASTPSPTAEATTPAPVTPSTSPSPTSAPSPSTTAAPPPSSHAPEPAPSENTQTPPESTENPEMTESTETPSSSVPAPSESQPEASESPTSEAESEKPPVDFGEASDTEPDADRRAIIALSASTLTASEFAAHGVTVTGSDFAPRERVSVTITPDNHRIPARTVDIIADRDGAFSLAVTSTQGETVGRYSVVAAGQESGMVATHSFSVTADPEASVNALPRTGAEMTAALIGAGLIAVGVTALTLARRRTRV